MKVLCIIPARYASTRLPGKPLRDIAGKPMIVRVYERAVRAHLVQDVVVATDDERIRAAVEEHGGRAVMTRADHATGTDRLAEVATRMTDYDLIINVQGDEPLIEPREPRLAPVPGERVTAAPDATTHEVTMVPVDADDDDSSDDLDDGYDDGVDDGDDVDGVDGVDGVIGIIDDDDPDTAPVTPLRLAHDSGSSPEGA